MPPPQLTGRSRLVDRLTVDRSAVDRVRWPGAAARRNRALADPVLTAYLNEQLAAATTLADHLRRAAATEELLPERATLLAVRREITADRAVLRVAMKRLDVPTNWSVQGVTWASARLARLLPLLHRLPVVERIPTTHPTREGAVQALLVLEELLGDLHRRSVSARLLRDLVDAADGVRVEAVEGLPDRAVAQAQAVEAAHRRCAAPLLER